MPINRHIGRSVVLQTLFETDAMGGVSKDKDVEEVFLENVAEFAPDKALFPFMKRLLDLVLSKYDDINKVIEKAAPQWPLERIALVDRNILRIGLAELLFGNKQEVPPRVAINEAIELAKEFGGESSAKFVNGVLGAVYKQMLDAGLISDEKPAAEPSTTKEVVGAVVYAQEGNNYYLALVHDIFGYWTLPKGTKQEGESDEDTLRRKIKEELGIDLEKVETFLGENKYKATDKDTKEKIYKHAKYYLVKAPHTALTPKTTGGLDDAQWFRLADIADLNFYSDLLPIITKAVNEIAKKKQIS